MPDPWHNHRRPRRRRAAAAALLAAVAVAIPAAAQQDDGRIYSEWSDEVTVTTDPAPEPDPEPEPELAAPSGVDATVVDHETVTVTWGAVEGADGYEVDCGVGTVDTGDLEHTFTGLDPETAYTCRVRAYLEQDTDGPAPQPAGTLWLSDAELAALPGSGDPYDNVHRWADAGETADVSDNDNKHDSQTYAQALLCAYEGSYCDDARQGLDDAIGTEQGGRTLELARNLIAYVLAADLIGYDDPTFVTWVDEVRTANLDGRTLISTHEDRPNNWGTHAGASRIAASAFLGDDEDVQAAAEVFEGWTGNRDVYDDFSYGDLDWQVDPDAPVGVNPAGSTIDGHSVDGVLPDDQRRGGSFEWPPPCENYVWEALQGATPTVELLRRQGYDAAAWSDEAVRRAFDWLHDEADCEADGDDRWQPHLANYIYGTDYPAETATQPGKNIGFTDWTHGG